MTRLSLAAGLTLMLGAVGAIGSYARGQRAVFFLQYARTSEGEPDHTQPPRVMGAGNEGECPVVGETVLCPAEILFPFEPATHRAFGRDFKGVAVPREEFISTVTGLRQAFAWPPTPGASRYRFDSLALEQRWTEAKLATLMTSSPLASTILAHSRNYERLAERDE